MRKLAGQNRATLAVLLAAGGTVLFLLTSLQQAARAEDADANSEILQKVRVAWDHRRDAVRTLQCDFTVHRAVEKAFASPPDFQHFKPRIPTGEMVESDRTYKFSMAGKKLALTDEGEAVDFGANSWKAAKIRNTFDGAVNRSLSEAPSRPSVASERKSDKADDSLTNSINLMAIWLSFSPITNLELVGCKTIDMTVVSTHTFHDGRECVELAMPRGSPAWRGLITVDPSRDYVPVRFCMEHLGKIQMDLSIQYVADRAIGWRVSRWDIQGFREGSLLENSMGIVTGFSVNEPLADDLFTIDFPEGVHRR